MTKFEAAPGSQTKASGTLPVAVEFGTGLGIQGGHLKGVPARWNSQRIAVRPFEIEIGNE